jgi:hypothetical protein
MATKSKTNKKQNQKQIKNKIKNKIKKKNNIEKNMKKIKTWNLNESGKISFHNLIKKYENIDFEIQYKKTKIPFKLTKLNYLNNYYYQLSAPNHSLIIDFKDDLHFPAKKLPHTIYLGSIHKNELYSGSTLVKTAIAIARKIRGVKILYLCDMATIECNDVEGKNYWDKSFDLSLYSLLVTDQTFYNKYGFQYYDANYRNQSKNVQKHAHKVQKIHVSTILKSIKDLNKLVKKNYYRAIYGDNVIPFGDPAKYNKISFAQLNEEIQRFATIYLLLSPYKQLTLKQAIIKMHDLEKDGCNSYLIQFMKLMKELYTYVFCLSESRLQSQSKNVIKMQWIYEFQKLAEYRRGLEHCYYIKKI